jgi:hypothetical protein
MKKATLILLLIPLIFATSLAGEFEQTAYAAPAAHGGGGGWHGGGGGHGGHFGGRGFGGGGGHFRHGGHFEGGIWFGPGWGFWDPFFYPYYAYPYYAPPAVVVPEQPQEYVMPAPQRQEPSYWYYCTEARGYYPYVKNCPGGWLKVVPSPPPSGQEE